MKMIKNMVNMKMNVITADELLKYAGQFNLSITRPEAEKVAYVSSHNERFKEKNKELQTAGAR